MYSNFMLLDQFLFELSCRSTHGNTHTHAHTHTHTHAHKHTNTHKHTHYNYSTLFLCFAKRNYY